MNLRNLVFIGTSLVGSEFAFSHSKTISGDEAKRLSDSLMGIEEVRVFGQNYKSADVRCVLSYPEPYCKQVECTVTDTRAQSEVYVSQVGAACEDRDRRAFELYQNIILDPIYHDGVSEKNLKIRCVHQENPEYRECILERIEDQ